MEKAPLHRTVRSFVRREGRLTPRQAKALDTLWPLYGLETQQGLIDFDKVYGRPAPVILEIGFGMGQALLSMALQNPQQNYLGIEVYRPGVGSLLAECAAQDVKNIRVFCNDAIDVLRLCIPDQSLDAVHIYFPDPWPKKRHHKRRLLQTSFIDLLAKKLKIGMNLHFATDWEDYAKEVLALLEERKDFHNANVSGGFMPRPEARPLTKFEQRGQRLGHGVWDVVFRRQA